MSPPVLLSPTTTTRLPVNLLGLCVSQKPRDALDKHLLFKSLSTQYLTLEMLQARDLRYEGLLKGASGNKNLIEQLIDRLRISLDRSNCPLRLVRRSIYPCHLGAQPAVVAEFEMVGVVLNVFYDIVGGWIVGNICITRLDIPCVWRVVWLFMGYLLETDSLDSNSARISKDWLRTFPD